MNTFVGKAGVETLVVGLGPGEMLLESIREAIKKAGFRNGAVISAAGTLKTCRMHFVEDTGLPPKDRIVTVEPPLELVSLSGVIADGEPHLHVVVSRRDEAVYAGHLEEGSEVLYLAEVAIVGWQDIMMKRQPDKNTGVKLLSQG